MSDLWPPNFTLKEMERSEMALRHGINNTMTTAQAERYRLFACGLLQPARDEFGRLRVSSGFRCRQLNTKAGGHPTSDHLAVIKDENLVVAADIYPLKAPLLTVFRWIWEFCPWSRLIWEFDSWIHISWGEPRDGRVPTKAGEIVDGKRQYPKLRMRPIDFKG